MALMYRHRPNKIALIIAAIILVAGLCGIFYLRPLVMIGERPESILYLVGSLTISGSGILTIIAFSRYQFTHLWRSTGAVHSDNYRPPWKKSREKLSSSLAQTARRNR